MATRLPTRQSRRRCTLCPGQPFKVGVYYKDTKGQKAVRNGPTTVLHKLIGRSKNKPPTTAPAVSEDRS